jgi:hypothetical protein
LVSGWEVEETGGCHGGGNEKGQRVEEGWRMKWRTEEDMEDDH